jgi:hypothetical protein
MAKVGPDNKEINKTELDKAYGFCNHRQAMRPTQPTGVTRRLPAAPLAVTGNSVHATSESNNSLSDGLAASCRRLHSAASAPVRAKFS